MYIAMRCFVMLLRWPSDEQYAPAHRGLPCRGLVVIGLRGTSTSTSGTEGRSGSSFEAGEEALVQAAREQGRGGRRPPGRAGAGARDPTVARAKQWRS